MKLALALVTAMLGAQQIDRTKPPETPPLAPYKLPATSETKLDNGLSVVLVKDARFPLVSMRIAFVAGDRYNAAMQPGLAETVASLIKSGTPKRTARQIAEELAAIGGALDANTTEDGFFVTGNALSTNLPKLLEIAADSVRNVSFPKEEIDLRKQNRIQELQLERSQSATLANEKLHAVVFGKHPYSQQLPTPEAIAAITREQLIEFRDKLLVPPNATLILVGNLDEKQALEQIRNAFASWPKKTAPPPPTGMIPKPQFSIHLIDRPGSAQVDVMAGHLGITRLNSDYFPMLLGTTILGGGASSRMFNNIREKQGFAYHASAHHIPYRDVGLFTATTQVREEVLEPAIKAVLAELDAMTTKPVTSEELTSVKNYLNGMFVMGLASQDGVAAQLASVRVNNLPADYLEKYIPRVRNVEPNEIQAAAAKFLKPGEQSLVIVGDASKIAKVVEKFGKVEIEKAK